MKQWIVGISLLILVFLTACGKQQFDDPNIEDQYWLYLEDEQTGQVISDQVLYTAYKNGTKLCGYAYVESEEQCYSILEAHLAAELEMLRQALIEQAAVEAAQQNEAGTEEAAATPETPAEESSK